MSQDSSEAATMAGFQTKSKLASGGLFRCDDPGLSKRDRAFARLVRRKRTLRDDHRALRADPQAKQPSRGGQLAKGRPCVTNVRQRAGNRDGIVVKHDGFRLERIRGAGERTADASAP